MLRCDAPAGAMIALDHRKLRFATERSVGLFVGVPTFNGWGFRICSHLGAISFREARGRSRSASLVRRRPHAAQSRPVKASRGPHVRVVHSLASACGQVHSWQRPPRAGAGDQYSKTRPALCGLAAPVPRRGFAVVGTQRKHGPALGWAVAKSRHPGVRARPRPGGMNATCRRHAADQLPAGRRAGDRWRGAAAAARGPIHPARELVL